MKKVTSFVLAVMLAACGQSEAPQKTILPIVEELASNPERLRGLRQQCKLERAKLGDELCNRVAEATRKRFYGDGKVPYTPPENPTKF
ncbi:putative lipoprotein YmbA [Burkholderia sp. OAS925]|uniref:entry exclusion lipoprotein TrbK n=1 Tax=Paraburkholderia TaxID=1822464 RepID=UPI00178A746B|nr:entry exclusion lipoprotein TrbK [Paraburkholderia graminis]MDR6475794.1 putative lipoprotein YmbA [Paraburkholderia graminis]